MKLHTVENYLLIGIITFGLLISGSYSFAYYSVGVKNSELSISNTNTTGPLPMVIFDAGNLIQGNSLSPGNSITKTFNVEFTPNNDFNSATYTIDLNTTVNTFTKCTDNNTYSGCLLNANELVYRLYRQIGTGDKELIVTETDITGFTGHKTISETIRSNNNIDKINYYYTLEIEFKNTNANQNYNENKVYSGEINVYY